jgi:geranylgeranyl reductase family protein
MLEYDVVVIGAGPIGGQVANKIAEEKYRVTVLEKNKEIGQHLNCAGLITPRVFDLINISKKDVIQNEIKGANIHSPSNKILTIGGNKTHALSIDRMLFDKEIIGYSIKQGAETFLENNVLSIQKGDDHYRIKTSEKLEFKCKLLIGADGPRSKTRELLSFPKPKEFLNGIGAEIEKAKLNPEFVEIFVGEKIAPGFFAWIIPTNKDGTNARIGLCITQKAIHPSKYYFTKMLNHKYFQPYLKNCKITRKIGGTIPLGTLKRIYGDNIMLVGDSAAQVKPTSGGGLYPGLLCAKHCSNVAIEALQKNNFASETLKKYQKFCQKDIIPELRKGMKFRAIYKSLSDKKMDKYIDKLQNPKIIETINEYGDIDYPSKLVKPLIKKTKFFI